MTSTSTSNPSKTEPTPAAKRPSIMSYRAVAVQPRNADPRGMGMGMIMTMIKCLKEGIEALEYWTAESTEVADTFRSEGRARYGHLLRYAEHSKAEISGILDDIETGLRTPSAGSALIKSAQSRMNTGMIQGRRMYDIVNSNYMPWVDGREAAIWALASRLKEAEATLQEMGITIGTVVAGTRTSTA
ncbi:hypothetical protein I317_00747 [Kwoniella heveanensis CBS 569]|nr:hypothetical protein I317_00747 [Kwoniella heveanensis CBS 569]